MVMKTEAKRILGNWMTSFLSPLVGSSIVFNLDFVNDLNLKILISALVSSSVVTGLVISRKLENAKDKTR